MNIHKQFEEVRYAYNNHSDNLFQMVFVHIEDDLTATKKKVESKIDYQT